MKQYKLNPKARSGTTTRQEIDSLTRQVSEKITRDPAKAAKIFKNWLEARPRTATRDKSGKKAS